MIKGGDYFNWEIIGALLAQKSSDEQIKFFKGFVREIETYDTNMAKEMQLIYVGNGLTDREKELLSSLSFKEAEC
jgi:hypothetical protein